jgi:hypothetical protein
LFVFAHSALVSLVGVSAGPVSFIVQQASPEPADRWSLTTDIERRAVTRDKVRRGR